MRGEKLRQWFWMQLGTRRKIQYGPRTRIDKSIRVLGSGTIKVGPSCQIRHGVVVRAPATLGSGVYLSDLVYIGTRTAIGDQVSIGQAVKFVSGHHEPGTPEHRAGPVTVRPCLVGNGVWIGAGALILPGVTIGDGSVIAAGSVVTADVEPHCMYAGVPATRRKRLSVV